ncbi:MAG: amidohydrolase [Steroidobacteraceae bacterium]
MRAAIAACLLALAVPPAGAQAPESPRSALPGAEFLPSSYRPLPRQDVIIAGATILDGIGNRHDQSDILLQEGKIAAIGRNLPRPDGVRVIEAAGRWITPGLIDIHSHNGTYMLPIVYENPPTWDVAEVSSPNVAETAIEHAINAQDPAFGLALAGGVTTLQVLPGSVTLFGGRSVVLKTVPGRTMQDIKFPDAAPGLKMACGENPKGNFGSKGQAPTSRQGEVAMMRAAWQNARDYRDRWRRHGRRDADGERGGREPPARDLELETLAGVLDGEIRVHLHCYAADDIAVMLSIAREFDFRIAAIHHAVEAYKVPDLLAAAGTCAAVWPDWWGFKMEAFDGIRENAAFVDAAGACAIMHSDSPFIGQHLTLEAAKAMAAGRRAGLDISRERSIAWVTSNPARALGLDDRIGRLATGFNADVVLWSGDPFSIYSKPDQVYVDGALAYDRNDPERQPVPDLLLGHPAREAVR